MTALVYRALAAASARAATFFYRVTPLGARVPAAGPILIVANHPNGLIDAGLVIAATARPVRFLAKAPLFALPVVGAITRALQCIPVYRAQDGADTAQNQASLAAASAALRAGAAICLFPEGKSHSQPELQRLKTGAARLALAAEAESAFALGVCVVPMGLVYREKQTFRSRMATWIGEPLALADLAPLHARDPWAAAQELTARIDRALRRVTLNVERWEDLPLLELAERIWRPGDGRRVPRLRALANGLRALRTSDPAAARALALEAQAFQEALGRVGIDARELDRVYTLGGVARFVLVRTLPLLLALPVVLAGAILWVFPYWIVRIACAAIRPTDDVEATYKVFASALVYPIAWAAWICAAIAFDAGPGRVAAAVAAPLFGLATVVLWERVLRAAEDARSFAQSILFPGRRGRLRARRDALAASIDEVAHVLQRVPRSAPPA